MIARNFAMKNQILATKVHAVLSWQDINDLFNFCVKDIEELTEPKKEYINITEYRKLFMYASFAVAMRLEVLSFELLCRELEDTKIKLKEAEDSSSRWVKEARCKQALSLSLTLVIII